MKGRLFDFVSRQAPLVEEQLPPSHPEVGEKPTHDVDVQSQTTSDDDSISSDAQTGVKAIEATTKVWGTSSLIAAYLLYSVFPRG